MSSHVGAKSGGLLHIEAPGDVTDRYYGVFGPYLNLGKGRYRAELKLSVSEPYPTGVVFDICCEAGRVQPYSQACAPADFEAGVVCGEFSLSRRVTDLEVRLNVPGGFVGTVEPELCAFAGACLKAEA